MTRSILGYASIVLILCTFPGEGKAQGAPQQTSDGAQAFMSKVLSNGSTTIQIPLAEGKLNYVRMMQRHSVNKCYPMIGCKDESYTDYYESFVEPFTTSSANKIAECSTVVNFKPPSESNISTYVPTSITIYWNNVTKAEASKSSVLLSGQRVKINFSSDDLAARFAYAATFLQMKCDPTAGTGF